MKVFVTTLSLCLFFKSLFYLQQYFFIFDKVVLESDIDGVSFVMVIFFYCAVALFIIEYLPFCLMIYFIVPAKSSR